MIIKLYETRENQINNTPIIYNNVVKIIDQTTDNEIDFLINNNWHNIPNRNNYYLIIIEQ